MLWGWSGGGSKRCGWYHGSARVKRLSRTKHLSTRTEITAFQCFHHNLLDCFLGYLIVAGPCLRAFPPMLVISFPLQPFFNQTKLRRRVWFWTSDIDITRKEKGQGSRLWVTAFYVIVLIAGRFGERKVGAYFDFIIIIIMITEWWVYLLLWRLPVPFRPIWAVISLMRVRSSR